MSGTIVLSKQKSFDVRTVDFIRIAGVLRSFESQSETAKKLLQTVDEFGMDMLCADDLSAKDFAEFGRLLKQVRMTLGGEEVGLKEFLDIVCAHVDADARIVRCGKHCS